MQALGVAGGRQLFCSCPLAAPVTLEPRSIQTLYHLLGPRVGEAGRGLPVAAETSLGPVQGFGRGRLWSEVADLGGGDRCPSRGQPRAWGDIPMSPEPSLGARHHRLPARALAWCSERPAPSRGVCCPCAPRDLSGLAGVCRAGSTPRLCPGAEQPRPLLPADHRQRERGAAGGPHGEPG